MASVHLSIAMALVHPRSLINNSPGRSAGQTVVVDFDQSFEARLIVHTESSISSAARRTLKDRDATAI